MEFYLTHNAQKTLCSVQAKTHTISSEDVAPLASDPRHVFKA